MKKWNERNGMKEANELNALSRRLGKKHPPKPWPRKLHTNNFLSPHFRTCHMHYPPARREIRFRVLPPRRTLRNRNVNFHIAPHRQIKPRNKRRATST